MLTAKQEKFVQNLVKGMSQREAYKNSYSAKNMADETIDNNASKLFKNNEISTRYKELIKEADDKAIMTAKERKIWLTELINSPNASNTDRLKALDLLNKMGGEYIEKVQYEDVTPKWFKKKD
jgi:phage terminase small subunit